jgi:hypothetical protein
VSAESIGYARERRVQELAPRRDRGYVEVRSDVRESLLVSGGRRVFEMKELMLVARVNGRARVAALGFQVEGERFEPLSGE